MSQYEHDKINETEMSELIKLAKEQELEKAKNKAKSNPVSNKPVKTITDISTAGHGDYVQTEDGIGAIVIDHDVELQKMREADETGQKLMSLLDNNSLISDANNYTPDYGEDAPENYDPGEEYIQNNPYDPKVKAMKDIKEGFADLTFGLNGLVDKNSDEGKRVAEAMDKLRTGEIVLPTPEEYEQQKQEALERRKKRQAQKEASQNPTKDPVQEADPEKDLNEELKMADMPEHAIIKKGADDLLNKLNETPIEKNIVQEEEPVIETVEEPKTNGPINLAGLEEELDANAHEPNQEVSKEPEIKPEEVVTINVPKGEADKVIETLPLETYDKVVKAKVVKVNEVELKDVPTKTTHVTDLARYRMLAQRRPKVQSAEVTERVLINSGFVVTLKSATSLEMATIFSSPTSNDVDWEKEYQFCYEHTVGTSIGKLSFNEFVAKVSPSDIETILFGIYEISETDTRKVSINCGTNDGGCGGSYEVDAEISKLPNYDALNEEAKKRVKEIIDKKGSTFESKQLANESPTATVKYVQCGDDRILSLRTTTGNMMIERIDRINEVASTHGAVIALLLLYVEDIRITVQERPDVEPTTFLLDTPDLLCEELLKLTDEEVNFVKDIITDDLIEYPTITFSIKGPCRCPHCGNVKDSIPCSISDLVFQKVQTVLE